MAIQLRLLRHPPNPTPSLLSRFLSSKSPSNLPPPPSPEPQPPRSPSLDDVRKNLSQYRRPDPPPPPPPSFSFSRLYERTKDAPDPNPKLSFDTIRASLKDFRKSDGPNPSVIGGGDGFQFSLFGNSNERSLDEGRERGVELLKRYTHVELGERLKQLRPVGEGEGESGRGEGFSFSELSERVTRLRELEEKESTQRADGKSGFVFDHLRKSLEKLKTADSDKAHDNLGKCEHS